MDNMQHYIKIINRYELERQKLIKSGNNSEIVKVEKNLKKLYEWASNEGYGVEGVIWLTPRN